LKPTKKGGPRSLLSRVGLALQILFITMLFVAGMMGAISAVLQRAVLEGSTKITVDLNESAIKELAREIGGSALLGDPSALEARLAAVRAGNRALESLFVTDGRTIVAASESGKAGTLLGGGAAEKGAEIKDVIAKGEPMSEIEKRTDITPRLTFIYPVVSGTGPGYALVSKFSLDEEFGAITHLREALLRILLIAGAIGIPSLFGLLWIIAIGPLRRLRKAAVRLSEGDFDIALPKTHSSELTELSSALASASASIKSHYERYLSPQVVELLMKERGFLRDIRMKATAAILVCDIEGFTALSEGMDVDDLGRFLNGYFRAMTEIIFGRKGTLDKYMGDGILAIFGAPLPSNGYRLDAVEAADEMVKVYADSYRLWLPAGQRESALPSRIRIGIASGEVFYGNVGYERRSDFTALGTVVNLASRLQELNKETGTTILVDERTAEGLAAGDHRFRSTGMIDVRGLSRPVAVFGR